MRKNKIVISLLLLVCLTAMFFVFSGCSYYDEDNEFDNLPVNFTVDDSGKFNIMQVTDLHLQSTIGSSDKSLKMVKKAIEKNDPDLVIVTGDIATPSGHYPSGALKGLKKLAHMMDELGKPWAVTYGNHDVENTEHLDNAAFKETLTRYKQPMVAETEHGLTDYVIDLTDKSGEKVLHSLIMMDTHEKDAEVDDYLPVNAGQVDWYEQEILKRKEANDGKTVPSSVFAHIPLPAYKSALADENIPFETFMPTINLEDKVYSGDIDNGFFDKMKELQSSKLYTAGHDHNYNWAKTYDGIYLQYARVSGFPAWGRFKEVEPGITMITIDTAKSGLDMYEISVQLYDEIMED